MRTTGRWTSFIRTACGGVLGAVLAAAPAAAQTTTATLRGTVTGDNGAPVENATVIARNVDIGADRGATTNVQGSYNLAGLRPGRYAITVRRIGFAATADSVTLQIGQTITRNYQLRSANVQLQAVVVTAAPVTETRTSELATNVTPQQIEQLPQSDRNFLELAVLAPGVTMTSNTLGGERKTIQAGAQSADQVNVFIDGATYKNDILQGGVAGQDASRGNPFPRNAVQEYRVLTQNYKAEYQKASSAIIVANTKTGGTRWEGNVFTDYLGRDWIQLDKFDRARRNANPDAFQKPDYKRYQFGASAGGPIADRFRFFGSFEAQRQDRFRTVAFAPPSGLPALDTVNFSQYNGKFKSPFREALGFGKVTFLQNDRSTYDLSYSLRNEYDIRGFDQNTAYTAALRLKNNVNTVTLKNVYASGDWLNEATGSFQLYNFVHQPENPGASSRLYGFGCCVRIGSDITNQDFKQRRASLRNDLTYSGWDWVGQHVVKGGANLDFLNYHVVKRNSEIPTFVYETWFDSAKVPERVEFQTGNPNFSDGNTQFGTYLQDDWTPVQRLTLNLGVRWDVETNMLSRNFKTPQNVRDSLVKYADSLYLPTDLNKYLSDGSQRSIWLGAIQPRIGASYAIDERERTTVFAGWGRYVDRTPFDVTTEERFAQQHPSYTIHLYNPSEAGPVPCCNRAAFDPSMLTRGKAATDSLAATAQFNTPEVKLFPNDLRPPMSNQWTVGVRQLLGSLAVELAYQDVRSNHVGTFYWGNMNFVCPERVWAVPNCWSARNVPGFSTILPYYDTGKTWYKGVSVKLDRPYHRISENFGWGAGLTYTHATRETQGFNDQFSFPNPADYPRQKRNDERNHVVANLTSDLPYLWGFQFGALVTLGSGTYYDVGDRFGCYQQTQSSPCVEYFQAGGGKPKTESFLGIPGWAYRDVDLRLRKDFATYQGNRIGIVGNLYNAFNFQNLGCFSNAVPFMPDPNNANASTTNPDYGRASCTVTDPRYFTLGFEYNF